MYHVVKVNKKLHIACDGAIVYTPPDFIRLSNRAPLEKLAERMNELGRRDIDAIIDFENDRKK